MQLEAAHEAAHSHAGCVLAGKPLSRQLLEMHPCLARLDAGENLSAAAQLQAS